MKLTDWHYIQILENYKDLKKGDIVYGFVTEDMLYIDPYYEGVDQNYDLIDNLTVQKNSDGFILIKLSDISISNMEPKKVTLEDTIKYLNGEINYQELCGYLSPNNGCIINFKYPVKLSYLYNFLSKYPNPDKEAFELYKSVLIENKHYIDILNSLDENTYDMYINDEEVTFAFLAYALFKYYYDDYIYSYQEIIDSVKVEYDYFNGKNKERSIIIMSEFVETHAQEANYHLFNKDPNLVKVFREYLDKMILQNNYMAIQAKAYLDYEGAFFWPVDYKEAKYLLEKLAANGDYDAYNTLGYLYYYHNPYSDSPDYDNAFKCFSLAAIGGNTEAKYKICDCLLNGYGTFANYNLAKELLLKYFYEEKEEFMDQNYVSKFADICYRLYKISLTDPLLFNDTKEFITLARFAIILREATIDYIGDDLVSEKINKAYINTQFEELINDEISLNQNIYEVIINDLSLIKDDVKYSVTPLGDDLCEFKLFVKKGIDKKILLNLPDYGKVTFVDSLVIKGYSPITDKLSGNLKDIIPIFDSTDDNNGIIVHNKNNSFFLIDAKLVIPQKLLSNKMHKMCLLLLNNQKLSNKLPYIAVCDDIDVKALDRVNINCKDEKEIFNVYKVFYISESDMTHDIKEFHRVINVINDMVN